MQVRRTRPETPREEADAAELRVAVELAAEFYEATFAGEKGRAAREYAIHRNLSADTIREFRIGFAPTSRDALRRHLRSRGIDDALMLEAGLIHRPGDGRPPYDRFRGRLIIPIQDAHGRMIALGGRAIADGKEPKYLNSPETAIFSKRSVLFNAHRAASTGGDGITVVEGYLDAISVWQAGIKTVTATLGTAFTEDQIEALWSLSREPIICFDGDRAGLAAAHRAIDRILPLLRQDLSFRFAFLPDGKDPDDVVSGGGGPALLAETERALPLIDVLVSRETTNAPSMTPEQRAGIDARLETAVLSIRDAATARAYELDVRRRIDDWFASLDRSGQARRSPTSRETSIEPRMRPPPAVSTRMERLVLGLAIEYPHLLRDRWGRLASIPLRAEGHRRLLARMEAVGITMHRSREQWITALCEGNDPLIDRLIGEIHGPRDDVGGRLRLEFPLLPQGPEDGFVADYLDHLMDRIETDAAAGRLENDMLRADADETTWGAILSRQRSIATTMERIEREGRALADRARAIRSIGGLRM